MHILDHEKPLSDSLLWQLQLDAYRRAGPTQWVVTNTPMLAEVYAHFVFGFLHDCRMQQATTSLDPTQPVYVLELGAGSGKFSYLLLRAFEKLVARAGLAGLPPLCLVMTDNVHDYQSFWRKHDRLRPLLERGVLDFSDFRADRDRQLSLLYSGKAITPESTANPLVVIANYFFDQIRQDVFRFHDGQLEAGLVTVASVSSPSDNAPLSLREGDANPVRWEYTFRAVDSRPAYVDDALFDDILDSYRARTEADVPFALPTESLRTIGNLRNFSGGRMLFIVGDKGPLTCSEFPTYRCDRLAVDQHGIFSFNVNFDAIGQYVRASGGGFHLGAERTHRFHVALGLWGIEDTDATHLQNALLVHTGSFGPGDYTRMVERLEAEKNPISLKLWLSLLEWSQFDPGLLVACNERVLAEIPQADASERVDLLAALERVWQNFFCVGPSDEPRVLRMAQLFYLLEQIDVAAMCLEDASQYMQGSASLHYYLGRCRQSQGRPGDARQSYQRALEINPKHLEARHALGRLSDSI